MFSDMTYSVCVDAGNVNCPVKLPRRDHKTVSFITILYTLAAPEWKRLSVEYADNKPSDSLRSQLIALPVKSTS